MNVGGNNAVGIGEQRTDFDPVAFFDQDFCRCADMLFDRNIQHIGNAGVPDRKVGGYFVFVGMNTAD